MPIIFIGPIETLFCEFPTMAHWNSGYSFTVLSLLLSIGPNYCIPRRVPISQNDVRNYLQRSNFARRYFNTKVLEYSSTRVLEY